MTPEDKKLPLMELFGPVIQGEGAVIGQQTYFFRFGGCDYRCVMCDSMHAVDPKSIHDHAEWLTQDEILTKFYDQYNGATQWITLSGGNPCIHDLTHLVRLLKTNRLHIAVETQGTIYQPWLQQCDIITVSPKSPGMGEHCDLTVFGKFMYELIDHPGLNVKVVVFDQMDLEFAKRIRQFVNNACHPLVPLYLSQGNPYPPKNNESTHLDKLQNHTGLLRDNYVKLFDMIKHDDVLSKMRFLPQLHVWLYGNERGR